MTANILVVSWVFQHPMRQSLQHHLHALDEHTDHRVFQLNMFHRRRIPKDLLDIPWDLIIFHTSLLISRWTPAIHARVVEALAPLADVACTKAAIPQDENLDPASLETFFRRFGVTHVFTVAPSSELPRIYSGLRTKEVQFHHVLTGYLSEDDLERFAAATDHRTIDLGYRAWHGAPWLGHHGRLKQDIAHWVTDAAPKNLVLDISVDPNDTLYGDAWPRFLRSCRWTLGVEGGASILDRNGSIKARTETYLTQHPGASYDEVHATCLAEAEGSVRYASLSPRHLEACVAGSAQLLVAGEYNGILRAGVHYLPLAPDGSDVHDRLEDIKAEGLRRRIVDRCNKDIVQSGRYTYAAFAKHIIDAAGMSDIPVTNDPALDRIHRRHTRRERCRTRFLLRPLSTTRKLASRFVSEDAIRQTYLKFQRR